MRRVEPRRALGAVAAAAAALLVLLAVAMPAAAHDPIILTDEQVDAAGGPLLPDGTISFALYGVLDAAGATRGFTARFAGGERLYLTLLIPNQAPEIDMASADLPRLVLTAPDGARRELEPTEREVFDEPFSATSYVRLVTVDETAAAGEYGIVVSGPVPARFTVAIGTVERFGTPVERVPNRDDPAAGVAGVQAWYASTPVSTGTDTVASTPVSTGSGTVAEWLWPLLIATAAGATAVAVGLYYGFVRPGRTRR